MIATRTFIKNFATPWPTDGSAADMEAKIGGLGKTTEILGLEAEISITGKSTAAAFALQEQDHDILVGNIVKNVRCSYNTETDNVAAAPDRVRDVANYAWGQDPYNRYKGARIGDSVLISSGATSVFVIPILIPFINVNAENVNQNALSGAQLNRDGRVNLDSAGVLLTTLNNLALTGGNINISAVSIRLYAQLGKKRKKGFVGNTQYLRFRSLSQNPDTEVGPFLDQLVFEVRDSVTLDGVVGSISIEIDSDTPVKGGTTTSQLAAGFLSQIKPQTSAGNGALAYDITNNKRHTTFVGGITGRAVLQWYAGATSPDESEVPKVDSYRTFMFTNASNGTIVYWRLAPIDNGKTRDAIAGVINENPEFKEAAGLSLDQLAVKGGGSTGSGAMNGSLRRYKPVWLSSQVGNA